MDNPDCLNVLSLCSGYAGLERGLEHTGVRVRTIAYVEREAYAVANLVAKMEAGVLDPAPIWTDVTSFDARPFRGLVDVVTAGYPCQPFSIAGKRLGTEDERHLFPHIERIIREVQPRYCFFENVRGHLSMGFREVYGRLRSLGYSVEAGIFSAEEVGAPHKRERLFILAYADGEWELQSGRSLGEERQRVGDCGAEVAHANYGGCHGRTWDEWEERREESKNGSWWESEPGLDRVVDGCPNRVDRLRLMGNGVVPQQAALAWETLRRIVDDK